ncbi:MAG: hypothetical protein ACMUJM_17625 [bacterium]
MGKKLLIICVLLLCGNVYAATPCRMLLVTEFWNKNWYPLEKKEMKEAAVDSALQEVTLFNAIEFVKTEEQKHRGTLRVIVSLVERASTAKITLLFEAEGIPSIVTSSDISLAGLDYLGIYNAFVSIGHGAGKEMGKRLSELGLRTIDEQKPAVNNEEAERLYKEAQVKKRAMRFEEARSLFTQVSKMTDKGSLKWRELSLDEIHFGLPNFEANQLLFQSQTGKTEIPYERIKKLYQYIIDNNRHKPERVQLAEAALDRIIVTESAMDQAYRAAFMSYVRNIQNMMMIFYANEYKAPVVPENIWRYGPKPRDYRITNYSMDPNTLNYTYDLFMTKTEIAGNISGNLENGEMLDIKFY